MNKSPFPGIDPYLEAHWGDIHTRLMVYASNQLNAQLPDDLLARVEEGPSVEEGEAKLRTVYADVRVTEDASPSPTSESISIDGIALAEPCVVAIADEPRTERHLAIVDTRDKERLVTAIEVLSPANKVGVDGQIAYLRKQREYLEAGANLVEIDLIRAGHYVLSAPEERLPLSCRTPYLICIRRATRPNEAAMYPISLRQSLPNIPIPLRPTDQEVVLQLQPLMDACYQDGRYHRINYRSEPTPRLSEADSRWLDEVLREKGLR